MTSGKALGEVLPKLRAVDADVAGFVVAVDREEVGAQPAVGADGDRSPAGGRSAVQQIELDYGVPVYSIITLNDIVESGAVPAEFLPALSEYRERYGVKYSA